MIYHYCSSTLVKRTPFRKVQVNQEGLKLNDTRRLFVYAEDIDILGGSLPTAKENTEALVVASSEIGLEVTAVKTSTWSCHEINAGRSHNIKTSNISFERVEEFKSLGTTLKNQNSIRG